MNFNYSSPFINISRAIFILILTKIVFFKQLNECYPYPTSILYIPFCLPKNTTLSRRFHSNFQATNNLLSSTTLICHHPKISTFD